MCFLCQSLNPETVDYDFHGLTGPTAAATVGEGSSAPTPSKPVYSLDQVATQLTHGYWQSGGGDWRAFDIQAGDTVTVNLDGLDSVGQAAAMAALAAWTAVSGLQFMATSGDADITFQDTDGGAYAYSAVYTGWNEIAYSVVNVHVSWQDNIDYYYQTYIHEIGHALGLGHGGTYNGSADFDSQAHYANDSWQMSVMSYFAQWENPNVDASGMYLNSPQMADILAIQNLYGTPDNVHVGDSVFGDNTNLDATGMDLERGRAVTIFDSSGIDLIDLGTRDYNQRLSLIDATWSDLDGYVGNFGIARGAVIENAITGAGNDHITGNAADNHIQSGDGADTIKPGEGDDTIDGGAGEDTVIFTGASEGYDLMWDGALRISDADLSDGDDGMDMLTDIETLSFADGAFGTIQSDGMVTTVHLYKTGSGLTDETLEVDVADSHIWQSITRSYSATGQRASQTNTYDNGRVLQISFADGQRTQTTMTDTADVYSWESYTDVFDDTGARIVTSQTWDSGKIVDVFYDSEGVRTGSLVTDGGDQFTWQSTARSYEADGMLTEHSFLHDDGSVQVTSYTGGARSALSMTDGPDRAIWSSYTDTFDTETGARVSRVMIYDDGREIETGYSDGQMVSQTIIDGADDFVWHSIAQTFDDEGRLASKVNTFDDGRIMEINFANGLRSSTVQTDAADAYVWASVTESYDDSGALVERITTWDNGTEHVATFGDDLIA
ncbi:M10 family metallopeptidase C-terminal domain-containing protein [Antarctobacter heliothermus]|uniref:Peptidase M10 serralysin C terminal n=1 Tax=Antarctobacter heliothermus TaxID=74033 RepID=A0A239D1D5_9RHOB|nr:M10 family metallopeptidase C-terminal domain-containing protein [Antarctobacter heliothermus]SNS25624.1 Peptidase M10 serralysin C terminal [Antarctobacter heliothermus]